MADRDGWRDGKRQKNPFWRQALMMMMMMMYCWYENYSHPSTLTINKAKIPQSSPSVFFFHEWSMMIWMNVQLFPQQNFISMSNNKTKKYHTSILRRTELFGRFASVINGVTFFLNCSQISFLIISYKITFLFHSSSASRSSKFKGVVS